MLVQGIVGAYVVFAFMRSRAQVRFSKCCVVTPAALSAEQSEGAGLSRESSAEVAPLELQFRLVRETNQQLRDAVIYVQARLHGPRTPAQPPHHPTPTPTPTRQPRGEGGAPHSSRLRSGPQTRAVHPCPHLSPGPGPSP